MTHQFIKFAQIVGGAMLAALVIDIKSWARAPKSDDGKYAPWDWQACVRHLADGFTAGLTATGVVAAASQ